MKKLLVLTLVLGLATVATATITVDPLAASVENGSSITISISSDNDASYGRFLIIDNLAGTLSNQVLLSAAGPAGLVMDDVELGAPGTFMFQALSFDVPSTVVPGLHFTVDYTANDDSSLVTIAVLDFDFNPVGSIEIQNTPEPMTLGLLGLGGLFLRRRK